MFFTQKLKSYGKFKVGEAVKVTSIESFNASLTFPRYLSRDEQIRYVYKGLPNTNSHYFIIKIMKLRDRPSIPLFVLEDTKSAEIYIVSENCIKHVFEKKM